MKNLIRTCPKENTFSCIRYLPPVKKLPRLPHPPPFTTPGPATPPPKFLDQRLILINTDHFFIGGGGGNGYEYDYYYFLPLPPPNMDTLRRPWARPRLTSTSTHHSSSTIAVVSYPDPHSQLRMDRYARTVSVM